MARPVMLGNGSLTVGLNEQGLVHDFYYPYVGLDNLTNARSVLHKIGVWVDGDFSWVDSDGWKVEVDFEADALISNIHMHHPRFDIELVCNDFVDSEVNAFCRRITVTNHTDDFHNVRLFLHQVFQISRAGRADTALFVPDEQDYLLDYKGRCSLLIYGQNIDGTRYDQFAVGNYGIEGKDGTYRDAEDGELSNNAVEHGGVDSVMRFTCSLSGGANTQIDYWIIAADSQFGAEKIHHQFISEGIERRLADTRQYWHEWISTTANKLHALDKRYLDIVKKSLMIIKVHTDKRGGVIASCDSSIYNYGRDYYSYVWPRDAAFAMWPLIRLGYKEEPRKLFEFCRDILTNDGYLMHKYQPDRAIGSTWHPLVHGKHSELAIQEDETALTVYMLGEFLDHNPEEHDFVYSLYTTLVQPAANFMSDFIDEQTKLPHASYDLWEQKFLTTTFTTAVVYQALLVAADLADQFEYPDDAVKWRAVAATILDNGKVFLMPDNVFRKGYLLQDDGSLQFDDTLDVSSLYGVMMFSVHEMGVQYLEKTVKAIEDRMLDQSPSGGTPRYIGDQYFQSNPAYQGNPWIISTLWMAQYYMRTKQLDRARHYIDWVMEHTSSSGTLSEQVNPSDGAHIGVSPLVWSHAELVNTILDMSKIE
jgi:GH15 family glucan-1,4-alpha-glucosidase